MRHNKKWMKGIGYILLASLCYGLLPSTTQFAFASGLSIETLLAVRFPLALAITWGYIVKKKLNFKLNKTEFFFVTILGILYIGFAILTNQSYLYLPGAVASILVFLYISIVVALEIVVGRERFSKRKIFCVIMSLCGLILVIGNPFSQDGLNIFGILLALCGGILYALYVAGLGASALRKLDSITIIGYVLIYPSCFNVIRCILMEENLLYFNGQQLSLIAILTIFITFLPALWFCQGIKEIGSGSAAIINTVEPIIAYFAGMFLMGDQLGIKAILGGIVILSSIVLLNASFPKVAKFKSVAPAESPD